MKSLYIKFVVLVSCLLLSASGFAQDRFPEKILQYHSDITVHSDASMTVTETIRVTANGNKIKRGIYRDFPTKYKDRMGHNVVVGFKVLEVLRDGEPDGYHFAGLHNGKRVYIGRKNHFLNPGEYTYTLTYKTDRQLGFFEKFDELYWNVTGNGWDFPILKADATVHLPNGTLSEVISVDGFTGSYGSTLKDFTASRDAYDNLTFASTKTLWPNQGLTIVVSWPKGFVDQPSVFDKISFFIYDNGGALLILLGLMILQGYYLYVWNLVGRDPEKGTIIPLFEPPKDFSPAAIRFIMAMGFDKKMFTVAVINMAVRGCVKIEEIKKKYTLKKTGVNQDQLTKAEALVAANLFAEGDEIELTNKNHALISGALDAFKRALKREYQKIYFYQNRKYFMWGAIFSFLYLYLLSYFGNHLLEEISAIWSIIFLLLAIGLNLLFYHLLKAPTMKGRKVMDKIEGFKMYLSVAEKEYLNFRNPPDKTPELFEKYLPYALALDVEQKWAKNFDEVLKRAAESGEYSSPVWYSGRHWHSTHPAGFASHLGGSFASTVSSSSVAPGSSSGGGGGFSGGGGGGGGGGGW